MAALTYRTELVTLEDWDALPEDEGYRTELAEGVLIVTPSPASHHQTVLTELLLALRTQLPEELRPVPDIDVLLTAGPPPTVRRPDLVVVAREALRARPKRFTAVDVALAVEVVSPGTGTLDHVTKAAEYAGAGISRYWVVDPDGRTLTEHGRTGDRQQDAVTHRGRVTLPVSDDHVVALDLDSITD